MTATIEGSASLKTKKTRPIDEKENKVGLIKHNGDGTYSKKLVYSIKSISSNTMELEFKEVNHESTYYKLVR